MKELHINPGKITKPIQLLGAWLVGLLSIDSCFLIAASNMESGSWESISLVVAAIVNVPLFLFAVFMLQTKFRPELQEDSYYSTYLNQKTNEPINIDRTEAKLLEIDSRLNRIEYEEEFGEPRDKDINDLLHRLHFGVNKFLEDRDQIKAKLVEMGVSSYSSFAGKEPPKSRKVSISQYLPEEIINEIIYLARELEFDYYSIYDNRGQNVREDVLIGSYGEEKIKLLPLDT